MELHKLAASYLLWFTSQEFKVFLVLSCTELQLLAKLSAANVTLYWSSALGLNKSNNDDYTLKYKIPCDLKLNSIFS